MPCFDRDEYVRLLEVLPPVKTRTAEQAAATEGQIEVLMGRPQLSKAERAYVDLLEGLFSVALRKCNTTTSC